MSEKVQFPQVVKSCPDLGLGYYPEGHGPYIKGKNNIWVMFLSSISC